MLEPKPLFRERMEKLLGSEAAEFFDYCYKPLPSCINNCKLELVSPHFKYLIRYFFLGKDFYDF